LLTLPLAACWLVEVEIESGADELFAVSAESVVVGRNVVCAKRADEQRARRRSLRTDVSLEEKSALGT
jgi:hypothetical protein